jgi:hypothetical protein
MRSGLGLPTKKTETIGRLRKEETKLEKFERVNLRRRMNEKEEED